ncbi:flavin monoamine oxidase family protein [Homoserinibacter sp. YIM 151385]|uniref:flavin monoamine oxidase family protein n=1 Tax=Homoserinibacter sp. YIM 151385 TaxID=2985506 RepID=UPI0022F058BB|nr:FAD-dependent oxidoreductase [Homoserinibacter sp. YIM 151385]WBU37944.1 FAD-dependent oxidoreductase [Homoserinibacter sp. YIM 151385]
MDRRTFLLGSAAGLGALTLAGCTEDSRPMPTPSASASRPPTPAAAMVRSRWGADDFARGATSFIGVGASPEQRATLAEPVEGRVFFAGEAASAIRPGTLRGAQSSAELAADRVVGAGEPGERVIVIGAGLAGAVAARRLTRAGFEVQVVEARDRTGGRIQTVEDDTWPLAPELGALWLRSAEANPIADSLDALGVGTAAVPGVEAPGAADAPTPSPEAEGAATPAVVAPDGEPIDPSGAARAVERALAAAAEGVRDTSLAEALEAAGAEPGGAVGAYLVDELSTVVGADAAELSAWYAAEELQDGPAVLVTGGLHRLVDDLLDGIDVALRTTVTRIGYDDRGVSVRFATGESLGADRVVVTVPLGVLKGEGLDFEPGLPFATRAAIDALGVGHLETIWLRFDEPVWDAEAALWTVVGDDVAVPRWINLLPVTGEPVLVGITGGAAAAAFAELDDTAAEAAALASLAPFLAV